MNKFTPIITTTITADGVTNPSAVALGTAVEVNFEWSPMVDTFYIDSCTATGLGHTQNLVENGCVVMSSASFMSIINPVLANNGQTLQFNQFAFSSGIIKIIKVKLNSKAAQLPNLRSTWNVPSSLAPITRAVADVTTVPMVCTLSNLLALNYVVSRANRT